MWQQLCALSQTKTKEIQLKVLKKEEISIPLNHFISISVKLHLTPQVLVTEKSTHCPK